MIVLNLLELTQQISKFDALAHLDLVHNTVFRLYSVSIAVYLIIYFNIIFSNLWGESHLVECPSLPFFVVGVPRLPPPRSTPGDEDDDDALNDDDARDDDDSAVADLHDDHDDDAAAAAAAAADLHHNHDDDSGDDDAAAADLHHDHDDHAGGDDDDDHGLP